MQFLQVLIKEFHYNMWKMKIKAYLGITFRRDNFSLK